MTLETVETEKNLLVENIVQKFSDLLALANTEEVMALDKALAQVMPALPTSVQKFNIGCNVDEDFAQANISFVVSPIKAIAENNTVIDKLDLLLFQLSSEDLDRLHEIINSLLETNPQKIKIHLGHYPVMEIAPQTWIIHFYLKTIDEK